MKILKNQSGSTMLMTLSLMALFGILLASFHISILSMTARVDSTYSEKQTYLYSRSAVTALAEELIALNQQYDEDWTDYRKQLSDYNNGSTATKPSEPTMNNLLSAVDGLTANSPTLTLTDCSFGSTLADSYKLDMDITRVLESDSEGNDVVAYKLRATTTIDGIKEVSDTVSLMLSAEGKEFEIKQESVGGDEFTPTPDNGVFSGIYTDQELNFGWVDTMLKSVSEGSYIVGGGDIEYLMVENIDNGPDPIHWMTDGTLTLNFNGDISFSNVIFYVDGDFNLNVQHHIKFDDCIFYVSGDMHLLHPNNWPTLQLNNCTIKSGTFTNNVLSDKYITSNTDFDIGANLNEEMAKIPDRPRPTWVSEAENSEAIPYTGIDANNSVAMTAGNVYRLDTDFDHWHPKLTDGIIGEATEDEPITIIVGAGVKVGVEDSCGEYIRFLVEAGGDLMIQHPRFHGDVYGYTAKGEYPDAVVKLQKHQMSTDDGTIFDGTFIVPKLQFNEHSNTHYGSDPEVPTIPGTSTETIRYNLYTDYIYVRG